LYIFICFYETCIIFFPVVFAVTMRAVIFPLFASLYGSEKESAPVGTCTAGDGAKNWNGLLLGEFIKTDL
jgi:hypothetical protein